MKKIGQVVATTLISQIISFLNAAFAPFKGTIFVYDDWESMASKTSVAAGFVIIAAIVALNLGTAKAVLRKRSLKCLIVTVILFVVCGLIYFTLKSGFAPTGLFLFILRDVIWMLIYIVMLVMVGVTIALAQLLLHSGGTGGGGRRTVP